MSYGSEEHKISPEVFEDMSKCFKFFCKKVILFTLLQLQCKVYSALWWEVSCSVENISLHNRTNRRDITVGKCRNKELCFICF